MRESCIQHRPKQPIAMVREDYYELTRDCVAAALLNEFEHRANAMLIQNPNQSSVNVGRISISEFERVLLGIATDKQIRIRLRFLERQALISVGHKTPGRSPEYIFHIDTVQNRLNNLGQMTEVESGQPRSNDRTNLGQTTEPTSVKQPSQPRSNDRTSIYKKDQDYLLEQNQTESEPEKTKNRCAPNPNQEQPEAKVELTASLSVQRSDRELAEGGESSAAAQNQKFQPQYESSAARSDRTFQAPPWGWNPAPEFLEYVVKNHLCHVDPYKSQQRTPSHRQAIAWLNQSKRDEGRLERASALYGDWQDSQVSSTTAAAPAISLQEFESRCKYFEALNDRASLKDLYDAFPQYQPTLKVS